MAYTESRGGAIYVEADGAEEFAKAYNYVKAAALDPYASLEFIEIIRQQ